MTDLRAIENAPATELMPPIAHAAPHGECRRGNTVSRLEDGRWFWHANGRIGNTYWFAEGHEPTREAAHAALQGFLRRMR